MAASFTTGIQVNLGLNSQKFTASLNSVKRTVKGFTASVGKSTAGIQRHFRSSFDKIKKNAGGFFKKMTRQFNELGLVGKATIAGITGLFLRGMSRIASSAEETRNKFQVVFKGVTDEADAAVERFRRLGQGLSEMRRQMARLQDTFVPIGFAREQAVKLSTAVQQLVLDLSSFNDEPIAQTADLMTSALVGNHRAVRRYSILITEARLDTELLRMGFQGVNKGATEQQKVLARLSLMLKDSKDAMGDLERTQHEFANTMRRLRERVIEVVEQAGTRLNRWILTTMERMGGTDGVAKMLSETLTSLGNILAPVADLFTRTAGSVKDASERFSIALTALDLLAVATSAFHTGLVTLGTAVSLGTTGFDELIASAERTSAMMLRFENNFRSSKRSVDDMNEAAKNSTAINDDWHATIARIADEMRGGIGQSAEEAAQSIKKLQQAQEDTARSFEQRGFELGFSGLQSDQEKIAALMDRIRQMRQQANIKTSLGDFEGARQAVEDIATLLERVNSMEGGAFAALRQDEMRALGMEMDRLFQGEQRGLAAENQRAADAAAQLQQNLSNAKTEAQELTTETGKTRDNLVEAAKAFEFIMSGPGKTPPNVGSLRGAAGGGAASSLGRATDPRDTIPALLRRGETVLTPEHSNRLAPLLKMVGVPGFAGGGNVDFREMLKGSRRFTAAGNMLRGAEDSQLRLFRAQQMKALIESVGFKKASELMIKQRQAGIPIVPEGFDRSSQGFFQGFAKGGRAGGTQQTNHFNVNIDYNTTGGNATDAVALAKQLNRAVVRKQASLN